MMEVRNLAKSYGQQPILRNINLIVEQGKTLAVLGRSGCGKTTLLRIVAGLISPDNGKVLLDGKDMEGVPTHLRNAVYMNQEPLLFPHLTVRQNIAFGLKIRSISVQQIQKEVSTMLEQLGLQDHADKWPDQLSGGQRQRVSFGRAIITQPSVLLLDEPFGNLDTDTRQQMQELFLQLTRTYQTTSLLVTHDLKEAILVGNETAYMEEGELYFYDSPAAFLADPRTGGASELAFWKQYMNNNI
ncbi:MAG TPA: sulfate ABC transporter ATP-binding protein [Bacteroidetes bacterium]|jgi:ABC-type Fe3+/spermidine/putrescine transport system ATPase subunit|nr:MAG: sulfate ABC transporter ATP-binding protein [Sphingobacteriales bacterium BACL12 MAG-120802-bin5]HCK21665.1 sulfate ABC transporter ATP-binding protein [Bacteroidota bacterium]